MRYVVTLLVLVAALTVATLASAQTATELKKDLLPKIKKAQAAGTDLGEAAEEYKAGDKALMDGLQEEALAHFKKAKALMPKE